MIKNRYLGIDLGTTNSCVAWGAIDAYSQKASPEVIPIRMAGVPSAQQLLPSVVMYKIGQNHPTGIGVSAKHQLILGKTDPENIVVRSVKLQMGKPKVVEAPWLTPEKVSSDILGFLKEGAERKLGYKQTDVVIGVPACFDTDHWEATKRAAELAGFSKITLIDEPKAALLDFVHAQDRLAPEYQILDFSSPKTICIFDPGGGTVDVSVVRIQQMPVHKGARLHYEMRYDDLGLARKLFLGGDNFDRLLADYLEEKFSLQTGVKIDKISDETTRNRIYGTFVEYAEDAKKHLSDQVMDLVGFGKMSEEEAINRAIADVVKLYLYETYGLSYRLNYQEYADIVAPLLGQSFNLVDLERLATQQNLERCLEYLNSKVFLNSNNIVLPICEAILQAKKTLGALPHIDIVLVNGGMSKLQLIRRRLKEFFGHQTPIIEVPDPDLSVARGAVLHHYNLIHGLDRTSNLLPEAIILEAGGTFVSLVPAGTQYPTSSPIIPKGFELVIPSSGIPYIDIPLWRGEPSHPVAKLAERRIEFKSKSVDLQKGDVVDIQVSIDVNRQLKLEAWLRARPNIRFEVTTTVA